MYQWMLKPLGDKLLGTEYSYGPKVSCHLRLINDERENASVRERSGRHPLNQTSLHVCVRPSPYTEC